MTLNELYIGESTEIKGKHYLSAKAYVEPFINKLSPLNPEIRIKAKEAEQVSVDENSKVHMVYNKVHIQAVLPKSYYYQNDCQKVIGMIYALDTKVPCSKFYIADIDSSNNLYLFNFNDLITAKLEDSSAIDYSPVSTLLSKTDINSTMIAQLKATIYVEDRNTLIHKLGEWVDSTLYMSLTNESGKIKLASSTPIDVYKLLTIDDDSEYYVDTSKTFYIDNIYRAFSYIINSDKDIINNIEKTLLIKALLNI